MKNHLSGGRLEDKSDFYELIQVSRGKINKTKFLQQQCQSHRIIYFEFLQRLDAKRMNSDKLQDAFHVQRTLLCLNESNETDVTESRMS